MQESSDGILIIGAGPTGLTLACSLAKYGIKFRIIDQRSSFSAIPRAINISIPTLNCFHQMGINEQFWIDGLRLNELSVYYSLKKVMNINYKYIDTYFPYFFHLEQFKVEKYLIELLHKYKIQVERNVVFEDFYQENNRVIATLKNYQGATEKVTYKYIIGCDGGNSLVRTKSNIGFEYKEYPCYFILMDAEVSHLYKNEKIRYYLHEDGYLMVVPLPDKKFRLIVSFKGTYPGKGKVDLGKECFQKILDKRGPGHIKIKECLWSTSAGFYHKLAKKSHQGNVYLAGDAFHQFSPVGGSNMNIGIQDACNLAEKMYQIKAGRYEESHLNKYSEERMDIAKKILKLTNTATKLLTRTTCLPDEEKKYLPLLENRQFKKFILPELFSGLKFINE
jgi:2-polyprenyl-6-methoxyphenol hydroxylase-like FAD-dependent oxidoreductase